MTAPTIRRADENDLAAINDIYNHYIRETPITFDIRPWTIDDRRKWFSPFASSGRYQLFVAETDGEVIGFAYSGRFSVKAAYDTTVETTVYLRPGSEGQGTGRSLYQALFDALASEDVHRACAGITTPNDASVALHKKFDFQPIGVYTEVGRKFDRYWDVEWFEKRLD